MKKELLELADFKEIVESVSMPILVGKPVYDDEDVVDFEILYLNKVYAEKIPNTAKVGIRLSAFLNKISKDVDWLTKGIETLKTGKTMTVTYYSVISNSWLHGVFTPIKNKFVVFTLTDITHDKQNEEQLRRQNLRLASLTDEISRSRESLQRQLDNIQDLNEELQFTAYHDVLTGLSNKQKLKKDFKDTLDSLKPGKLFGLILLDLDNMKIINDSEGHSAGDEVICRAAAILKRFQKQNILCYHFGGDEFIILVKNISSKDSLLTVGDTVLEACNEQGIDFSAGIAVYPDDSKDFNELLKFADMAMYDVKKRSKNDIAFFHLMMQDKFLRRLKIQHKMNDALENNVFQLYYQPQFEVKTNKLRGFEALLRWYDDDLGWINPEQFIPIAEESRLVLELGDWVMRTALKTLHKWTTKYHFDGIMSVNVSPVQLKKASFIFDLAEMMREFNIRSHNLEIEITEGVLIDNKDETVRLLKQIRDMGIGISLDDFGTGYSSLSYLQILPITTLKIDKSFISNITEKGGVEANITDSIVSMVTKMGLDTIAEGVENQEQLQILSDINCKNVQGFLKGKPMPEDRCSAFLSGNADAILTI
ncbi:MAG: bifunctional diguanylate cyclase/phosphodiesterase [Treponema sp.]|nr:bifunctional diguanylate cyclase/phosphodiesterase [Treponema sp.]